MLVRTEDGNYLNLLGCHLTYRGATQQEEEETETEQESLHFVVLTPLEERVGLEFIVARALTPAHARKIMSAMADAMEHDCPIFDPAVVADLYLSKKMNEEDYM